MARGIVYLDVDDEITSAAARIRDAQARRVALVLPYGSRVATSRINFRLLSRDALINEKQLAVVAGDSATRALAASAGLPVFATVGEYESSVPDAGESADAGEHTVAAPAVATPPVASPPARASPPPTAPSTATPKTMRGSAAKTPAVVKPSSEPIGTAGVGADEPTAVAAAAAVVPVASRGGTDLADRATSELELPRVREHREDRVWAEPLPSSTTPAGPRPQAWPAARRGSRLPIVIFLAALGLVVLAGGVGAYLVLPSATIVVTPRAESLGPMEIKVTADPTATEPNTAARVIPAEVVRLEVSVNDSFAASGMRVEETAAKGVVRFSNLDFLRTNTVAAGSIVSTNAGVRFRTAATVTVPRADLVGLTVFPGRINVNVIAVEPGTTGNVEPNTIVIVPRGEDPQALKVVNLDTTSGGTHEEFPQIAQKDIDTAIEQLTAALDAAFEARLAEPAIVPPGATVFGETASLGEATPSPDPASLVGQEVDAFELGLRATGTVVTVDAAPVSAIADEFLRATVEPGHQLVADSIEVHVGQPVVSGRTVAFAATATGEQVAVLDPDELRALVLGKSLDDARVILAPYGDVELTQWPDWVGSVPTLEDRVDLRINEAVTVETTTPSAAPS